MPQEKMLDTVLRKLGETRGRWPEVSDGSGVPYQTLTKIACGVHSDPRVSTVQTLFDYFASRPEQASPVKREMSTH
ncbi:putative transcriptional regulator [Paraburkholderia bryophila]|uniref:Putative transcriptional regulator n=1 Tax=Paraburkholderia bryophila TaxID=420952 RepID=A0A7Z0AXD0_9BURK|nr:putative transcriptional regulator [Paraburkholderia bryophila]